MKIENFAVGVDVPSPRLPADVRRSHSLSPFAEFLVKNARSEVGEVVDTLVSTDAMRAVDVAVVVEFTQFASEQSVVSLKSNPVPVPATEVDVE